jgi:ribosomal-protein-alanine N-acetyltransferase
VPNRYGREQVAGLFPAEISEDSMQCVLETPRLCLRLWNSGDYSEFARLNADPVVMKYFPETLTLEASNRLADKITSQLANKKYGLWATEIKNREPFAGFIGLDDASFAGPFTPCLEIGWRLKKEFWGKGYATEGAQACLAFAFETLGSKEVYSFTSQLNIASERVMEKIGMKKIGEFDHPLVPDTSPLKHHVLYQLTDAQYFHETHK